MMAQQLAEAGVLLGVGMAVVFAFLALLIGAIHFLAWFSRLLPQVEVAPHKNSHPKYNQQPKKDPISATIDPRVMAAISAAVNTHRRRHTTT